MTDGKPVRVAGGQRERQSAVSTGGCKGEKPGPWRTPVCRCRAFGSYCLLPHAGSLPALRSGAAGKKTVDNAHENPYNKYVKIHCGSGRGRPARSGEAPALRGPGVRLRAARPTRVTRSRHRATVPIFRVLPRSLRPRSWGEVFSITQEIKTNGNISRTKRTARDVSLLL